VGGAVRDVEVQVFSRRSMEERSDLQRTLIDCDAAGFARVHVTAVAIGNLQFT
jgi:hypothetical protein